MRIESALKPVRPTALLRERRKLVLPDNVRREPVRIRPGLHFSIRQNVNFTMRLFEWLTDFVRFKPAPPACDDFHFLPQRMPKSNAGLARKPIQRPVLIIHHFPFVPDAGRLLFLLGENAISTGDSDAPAMDGPDTARAISQIPIPAQRTSAVRFAGAEPAASSRCPASFA